MPRTWARIFHDRVVSLAESRDYSQSTERHDQQIVLVEKKNKNKNYLEC